jgi:hypothetical protein
VGGLFIMHFHSSYSPTTTILRNIRVTVTDLSYTNMICVSTMFVLFLLKLLPFTLAIKRSTNGVIDFNKACRTIFMEELPQNKLTCLRESQYVGDRYFIGGPDTWLRWAPKEPLGIAAHLDTSAIMIQVSTSRR